MIWRAAETKTSWMRRVRYWSAVFQLPKFKSAKYRKRSYTNIAVKINMQSTTHQSGSHTLGLIAIYVCIYIYIYIYIYICICIRIVSRENASTEKGDQGLIFDDGVINTDVGSRRNNELVELQPVKSFCLPLLTYCLGAIEVPGYKIKDLSVCRNDSFRKNFVSIVGNR